jgi:phosphoglycolate phosphatase
MVLDNLIVHKTHRGKGIGTGLMAAMESLARAAGCSLILLVSGEQRTEAHRLGERLDYSVPVRGYKKRLS